MNPSFHILFCLTLGLTLDTAASLSKYACCAASDRKHNGTPKKSPTLSPSQSLSPSPSPSPSSCPPRISCSSEDTRTKATCEKTGCIWDPSSLGGSETSCIYPVDFVRIDCLPNEKINRTKCLAKGCHWLELGGNQLSCIYPPNYRTHRTDSPECASDVYTIADRAKCTPDTRNKTACKRAGCCWSPLGEDSEEPWCFRPWNVIRNKDKPKPTKDQWIEYPTDRFNCFPRGIPNEVACEARGCFWDPYDNFDTLCFYPSGYKSYSLEDVKPRDSKFGLHELTYKKLVDSMYPDDMELVQMSVDYETETRVRIKIFHPGKDRFTPTYPTNVGSQPRKNNNKFDPAYTVIYNTTPGASFGFAVERLSTKQKLFDTRNIGGFTMADQFLQLSAKIGSSYVYGLGESRENMLVDFNWQTISFFAKHESHAKRYPSGDRNYGSHPFYLAMEPDYQGSGRAHGVLLLNSNALEVELQPETSITYRATGGILDFYFFLGETPLEVIREYHEVIGKPHLPPYWSLGFHLTKSDWRDLDDIKATVNSSAIPVDVIYVDLDERHKFCKGLNIYCQWNPADVKSYIRRLHSQGIKLVSLFYPTMNKASIVDKGQRVLAAFIKQHNSPELLTEELLNSEHAAYIDFTHPQAATLWAEVLADTRKTIQFDGVALEYNEPTTIDSDFLTCPLTKWDDPPFVPRFNSELKEKTLCMSATHHAGLHYDVHNLYGISQSAVTYSALSNMFKSRPFIVSRSTFPGSGSYAAHSSTHPYTNGWESIRRSITEMVLMNMFGVPMVGTDICGSKFTHMKELCTRWSVLGAFYPLSLYSSWDVKALHFGNRGGGHLNDIRSALLERYALLPYLYTLLYKAHLFGEPVVRPLFFEFPGDTATYELQKAQFLWGSALLFVPVLEQWSGLNTYLPGAWYSYPKLDKSYIHTGHTRNYRYVDLTASVTEIPMLIRAGSIIVQQTPANSLAQSRVGAFKILVALDQAGNAEGELYWDDGETLDSEAYNHISLQMIQNGTVLEGVLRKRRYEGKMPVALITIVGLKRDMNVTNVFIYKKSIGVGTGLKETSEKVPYYKLNKMDYFNVLEVNTTNLLDFKNDVFQLKFEMEKEKPLQKKIEKPVQKKIENPPKKRRPFFYFFSSCFGCS